MAAMTPFRYIDFYDVPRTIALRHHEKLLLVQSAFDEDLDEFPPVYSVYVMPESVSDSLEKGSWKFLADTPMECIGHISVDQVVFDPTKREQIDVSFLDRLIPEPESNNRG